MIIDYKMGRMPVGPDESMKVSSEILKRELRKAGFQIEQSDTTGLQYQYMIKGRKS